MQTDIKQITYKVPSKKAVNTITGMIKTESNEYIILLLNNLQNGKELIIKKSDIISIEKPEAL